MDKREWDGHLYTDGESLWMHVDGAEKHNPVHIAEVVKEQLGTIGDYVGYVTLTIQRLPTH
jgi:hypothetical protein